VKIGVALPQTTWPTGEVWPLERIVDYGVRAEAAGYDSLWSNDHFFMEVGGRRRVSGGDPLVLLSYLAARTSRVQLGTLVLCARFREPGQLAREAKTLAELSGGRLVLGIGAGWHDPEFDAFGIARDHLYSRFEEYFAALRALLADGRADFDGRYYTLRGAEVPGGEAPPVWVGANGPKMLELTGRHADGWNGVDPALLETVRAVAREAGRDGAVTPSTGVTAILAPAEEVEPLVAAHPSHIGGPPAIGADALRDAVEQKRAAGFEHLILHFSGAIWSSYGDDQLELAAEALGLSR
jgi:alkanesulfonate monooxygenase SsuD/methylene tetrahydromethanopterin reductase-like flavin-dependent oxidoreductase (luciferase family)